MRDVWPGRPFPLGATWDGGGTNFSIFSEHAESVDLCLFDEEGEEHRIQMTKRTALNWHCYIPGVGPGQRYGYRVHGPYSPHEGHRFNASKLLIDPYAKSIEGVIDWSDPERLLPYFADGSEDADLERHDQDDSDAIPKSIVIDDAFIWEGDRPPLIPFSETLIYETHVKGFTMNHPDVRRSVT
jgi:isoamylase